VVIVAAPVEVIDPEERVPIVVTPAILLVPPDTLVKEAFPNAFKVPLERVVIVAVPPEVKLPPERVVTLAAPVDVNDPDEKVPTVAAPEILTVPPEILAADVWPRLAAETVPLEIAPFNAPVTETVPPEIPLVIVALLPKVVDPAPESEEAVIVPVPPLKFTVPELLIALTDSPVPEILAVAPAATVMLAEEL
jgi:hypothetical protein